jgi:ribosome biogenesis GTPase
MNTNETSTKHNRGIVYKKTIGNYTVYTDTGHVSCSLSSRLRKELGSPVITADGRRSSRPVKTNDNTDPIAIGDEVVYIQAPDGAGMIIEVLPRRNKLARRTSVPMPSARPFEQVIVANIDQVVPVFSAANPQPKWNLLDRYLVSAESAGIPALVCITKLDLVQGKDDSLEPEISEAVEEYRRIGYQVVLVSAFTGQGIAEMKAALRDKTSVLLGKSGVGKTSLLNALQPGLGLRVNEVSQVTGKGKHTTTHLEMFSLDFGGSIVDTPGVREFGLWDVDEHDLAGYFPEMRQYIGKCRFGLGCRHDEEPGCAIREAVTRGRVSPNRYQSYMRLKMDAWP